MHDKTAIFTLRRTIGIFALAILLMVVCASLVFGAETQTNDPLQLRSNIVVEDNQITFDDVFANAGELGDILLQTAPLPGRRVFLHPASLSRLAASNGRSWNNISQVRRVLVKRAGRRLQIRELSNVLQDELRKMGDDQQYELRISTGASGIYVPRNAVAAPVIEQLEINPDTGAFMASLIPYLDAAPVSLRGRAWVKRDIPVLARPVANGEVIAAGDITWISARLDRLGVNPILDETDMIGKAAKRSLGANKVLRHSDLKTPDMVKKGELITIVYELPGLKLTARGKALANASQGDMVRVINLHSNRTIDVTIIGPGQAIAISTQTVGG